MKFFSQTLLISLFSTSFAFAGNIYECTELDPDSDGRPIPILHEVRIEEIGHQEMGGPRKNYDYKVATEVTVNVVRGNRLIERETIHADAIVTGVNYEIDRVSPNFRFWLYMDGLDQCGMDFISNRTGRLERVNLLCHWVPE